MLTDKETIISTSKKYQIIKLYVDFFDTFIKENFPHEEKYYILTHDLYKKLNYEDKIQDFTTKLSNYYFFNKQYYVTRDPLTYKNFITIIRQICNRNNVVYKLISRYTNSIYSPKYHIYL